MFENVAYPGNLLSKVVAHDPKACEKIFRHAGHMFEQQKKYIEIVKDDAFVPNPFTLLRNIFARSHNAFVSQQKEPLLHHAEIPYGYHADDYNGSGLRIMSPNLQKALLAYIEQNRESLTESKVITREDIHKLRDHAGWENRPAAPGLERHV